MLPHGLHHFWVGLILFCICLRSLVPRSCLLSGLHVS
jgi:hypothetical protein